MFGIPRIAIAGMAVAALLGGVWLYGNAQYRSGARDTTRQFLEADLKGADNARKTAEKVLADIGDDPDVDGLLRDTGGLRD